MTAKQALREIGVLVATAQRRDPEERYGAYADLPRTVYLRPSLLCALLTAKNIHRIGMGNSLDRCLQQKPHGAEFYCKEYMMSWRRSRADSKRGPRPHKAASGALHQNLVTCRYKTLRKV